ncbi:MAG: hypothetical protein ACRENP_29005, partial [Longimicrobiales bacterium]
MPGNAGLHNTVTLERKPGAARYASTADHAVTPDTPVPARNHDNCQPHCLTICNGRRTLQHAPLRRSLLQHSERYPMVRRTVIRIAQAALQLISILAVWGVATGAAAQTGTQLFRNARVFDGDRVLASTDVLVRAGRIAEIGRGLA